MKTDEKVWNFFSTYSLSLDINCLHDPSSRCHGNDIKYTWTTTSKKMAAKLQVNMENTVQFNK